MGYSTKQRILKVREKLMSASMIDSTLYCSPTFAIEEILEEARLENFQPCRELDNFKAIEHCRLQVWLRKIGKE